VNFDTWYTTHHGYPPFPWQSALAKRIADADYPDAITAPTSSGKTGIIAVWLWARLNGYDVPRRLVYVIDRRIVVNGVMVYATDLAESLPESDRPAVVEMRGGITIDNDWVLDPRHPTIIISTVDQAGSRLLFSGYGVSRKAAPIPAALLGNDALWVLDEVHLAQPLLQTLGATQDMGAGIRLLPMSATWDSDHVHGLGPDDLTHPVLAPRLRHPKPARLLRLKGDDDLSQALAEEAVRLRNGGADVVGIVCNRVATARVVFERLRERGDAVLLTGRIRPVDKDTLLAEYLPRMEAGSRSSRAPLYVVATQTIEVGADLDLDALVTECAPLSALRQRAGRLNRLGELESAPMAVVYQPIKEDRVYGDAVKATWDWLAKVTVGKGQAKHVDFGVLAMDEALAQTASPPESQPSAPLFLRSHLEMLASNVPHGLDITPWLHGWKHGAPDVYLCWRADWDAVNVAAAPPRQHELLAVPLWAVRQWSDDIADTEEAAGDGASRSQRDALRWDGEQAERISLRRARAGDTLILPCEAGGCDRYGWAPHSRETVTDIGDDARRMRLHPAVRPELAAAIAELLDTEATVSAWRALAQRAGMASPGRVVAVPGGCVVLRRDAWTSAKAYREVPLSDHGPAVGAEAAALGQALGLLPQQVEALRRAGAGHDAGKADRRWQAMVGGDGTVLLAKGPGGDDPWLALPRGWRHEMGSVARLEAAKPLVRYLIGTHHGHGRPLFPANPEVELWRAMGDWAGLRAGLIAEHGYWGLALLEALVRLADWRVSDGAQTADDPASAAVAA
jgi:CRISPR-associated endonuclease/helicase Cas3